MKEEEIAEKKVIPFLEKLGWSKQLLTKYGRVPVQMGTEVKYADIVALFIDENDITHPYLVVEVKRTLDNIEEVKAQVVSYAKQLDAQVLAVTDGDEYKFFQRSSWGGYINIKNIPIPEEEHLKINEKTTFKTAYVMYEQPSVSSARQATRYGELDVKADSFFDLIALNKYWLGMNNYSLRNDIIWHYKSVKEIRSLIHEVDLDSLKPDIFKDIFQNNIMCEKSPNRNKILNEIDNNFDKIKSFLKFLKDFAGSPQENLSRLFDRNDELHIKGIGPFITSQFLAGAHPDKYAIIEDRMVNTLKTFKLIDVKVHSETPNGYLYINDMCKKILDEVFKEKIDRNKEKLGFKIDRDFDLVAIHEFFWEYEGFYGYDKTKLLEAKGEELEKQKKEAENLLEIVSSLTR